MKVSELSYMDMVNLNNKKPLLTYSFGCIRFKLDDIEYEIPYSNTLCHLFPCWGQLNLGCVGNNYKFKLLIKQMFSTPELTLREGEIAL